MGLLLLYTARRPVSVGIHSSYRLWCPCINTVRSHNGAKGEIAGLQGNRSAHSGAFKPVNRPDIAPLQRYTVDTIGFASAGQKRCMGATGKVTTKPRKRRPKAALELTDEAAARLRKMLEHKPDAVGIRVGVTKRGCNGMSYTMNYATEKKKFDEKVEDKGVTILVEPRALMTILGTTLDWHEDDISAEFVFNNPNAKGACGCGESFNV